MFVARSSTVCGLETRARLPGCSELTKLVAAANLTFPPGQFLSKFEEAVEEGFHAELHGMVGGAWDCQMHDGTSLDMGTMAQNIPKVSTALSPEQERFCDARRTPSPPPSTPRRGAYSRRSRSTSICSGARCTSAI